MNHRILVVAAQLVLGTLLLVCLYTDAATASISDAYAPGIAAFRLRLHPLWLIACLVAAPMAVKVVSPMAWRDTSRLTDRLAFTALVVSAAFLIGLAAAHVAGLHCTTPAPAPPRELVTMLRHSLGCPAFSNRSYSAPFLAAGISFAIVLVGRRTKHGGLQDDEI